jgi:hypothetical protein
MKPAVMSVARSPPAKRTSTDVRERLSARSSVRGKCARSVEITIREAVGKRGVSVIMIPGDVALQSAIEAPTVTSASRHGADRDAFEEVGMKGGTRNKKTQRRPSLRRVAGHGSLWVKV